jgi:hypothetical protein
MKSATSEDEFPLRNAAKILRDILGLFRNPLLHPFSMPWRYAP